MKCKLIIFSLLVFSSSLVFGEQTTSNFDSNKIKKIEVQSGAGKVKVVATNEKTSTIVIDKIKVSEKCLITTELNGDVLLAKAESKGDSPCEINFSISVPAQAKLNIKVGSGDIDINNMLGPIDYKTGSGDVIITNSGKKVEGKSGSGDVTISGIVEEGNITTGSGDVKIDYILQPEKGELEVRTGNGSTVVGLPEGSSIEASLKAGSGSVHNEIGESEKAKFKISVKSGSGDIKIKKIKK